MVDRSAPTKPMLRDRQNAVHAGEAPLPVLVALTGQNVGDRWSVEHVLTVGRDPRCDVTLNDAGVGWHHCVLRPSDEGWVLDHLDPDGHTEVNGMRVSGWLLSPDDQLLLGRTVVRFEVHDAQERRFDEIIMERLQTDELTGLLSRRAFDLKLHSLFESASRHQQRLVVAIIDIDGLKAVNDGFGHLAGASVIRQVGEVLSEHVSEPQIACRMGGDEMGVAWPESQRLQPMAWGDALLRAIRRTPFVFAGEALKICASIGMAIDVPVADGSAAMLRSADATLYRAKALGGDRCLIGRCVLTS